MALKTLKLLNLIFPIERVIFLGLCSKLLGCIVCTFIILSGENVCGESTTSIEDCAIIEDIEAPLEGTITEDIEDIEEEVIEEFTFMKPVAAGVITSKFGMRRGKLHTGIDIADSMNTEIYAAQSGKVICASYNGNYGNLVKIDHGNGYITYYAHCNRILVSVGDIVEKGQLISKMGMTGWATGPHVHFEIRLNGEILDPYEYIY